MAYAGENLNLNDKIEQRLYVGNVHFEITKQHFQQYFARFGTVVHVHLESPKPVSKLAGYAMITFSEASAIEDVLKVPSHVVYGHVVHVERAKIRKRIIDTNKVFVAGISTDISVDEIESYFSAFGKVEKIIMYHQKNYAFVVFESDDIAAQVCAKKGHIIKNTPVVCEKPWPKIEHQIPAAPTDTATLN